MLNGNTFDHLDPLLQARSRLGACVPLSRNEALSFTNLKTFLGSTAGKLGAQLTKRQDKGYLSTKKAFIDRKPATWYALSSTGSKALNITRRTSLS
ncbi:transcriptional regulator [Verrucomicrobiales bacterium]|nr:transcriptional regulator [Verrucomicrobiales bacterium]